MKRNDLAIISRALSGISNGRWNQSAETEILKQKAVALHVNCDWSVNQIGNKLHRNSGQIRKWLIQAGVYKIGHRLRGGDPATRDNSKRLLLKVQRAAWLDEWKTECRFDETQHWGNHPAIASFRSAISKPWLARYQQERLDPQRRIGKSLRHRIWKAIKNANALKRRHSADLIGCDRAKLIAHLVSRFTPAMSLETYGVTWEVDHIIPCSHFDLTRDDEQRRCFHYTNLQPLPPSVNRSKHALEPGWQRNHYT